MTAAAPTRQVRLLLTVDGSPAAERPVAVNGVDGAVTDTGGALVATLAPGRHSLRVSLDEGDVDVPFVIASGVTELILRVRREVSALDDPRIAAAMPGDRYRPLSLLGRGAVGSVYRCRDLTLERDVAIKLLDQAFTSSDEERAAFLSEGRALAAIDHPNLIAIHDLGFHEGRGFMVVQYIDGPDLDRYLQSNGPLPIGALAAVGAQLARGLDALHRHGLVHRDLKPSNGIVDRKGVVRLADFGLARPIEDFTDPRSQVFGTPAYMSPEQLQALALGPASDVYGLGATLYHLATGRLPYEGENIIVSHVTAPPPDLAEALPDAPPMLCELLRWMMAKKPDARPSAAEVAGALAPLATRISAASAAAFEPRLGSSDEGSSGPSPPVATLDATPVRTLAPTPASAPTVSGDASVPDPMPRVRRSWVLPAIVLALAAGAIAAVLTQSPDAPTSLDASEQPSATTTPAPPSPATDNSDTPEAENAEPDGARARQAGQALGTATVHEARAIAPTAEGPDEPTEATNDDETAAAAELDAERPRSADDREPERAPAPRDDDGQERAAAPTPAPERDNPVADRDDAATDRNDPATGDNDARDVDTAPAAAAPVPDAGSADAASTAAVEPEPDEPPAAETEPEEPTTPEAPAVVASPPAAEPDASVAPEAETEEDDDDGRRRPRERVPTPPLGF